MRFSVPLACFASALALAGCGSKQPDVTNGTEPKLVTSPATAPGGRPWTETVIKTPEGGYRMGNPNAPLKLVEYGSRTCPTCGLFGREGMQPLENNYVKSGKVSYEFRDYMVHGAPDLPPALLGRCGGTEIFFPLLEQMYQEQAPFEEKLGNQAAVSALQAKLANADERQVATGWADYLGYVDFVKQRGIPEAKARACLTDKSQIDALLAMTADAQQNKNVTGTPTFFLNGKLLDGELSWPQIEQSLKAGGA